jgi:hypothetical protein
MASSFNRDTQDQARDANGHSQKKSLGGERLPRKECVQGKEDGQQEARLPQELADHLRYALPLSRQLGPRLRGRFDAHNLYSPTLIGIKS